MDRVPLNEHDANQGAQSRGEFLGMDGNSGWYLLGAAGIALLGVIVGWGLLGFSLLACLIAGFALCLLALAYVFALKNKRPAHFDTDFFEATLIEAGVLGSNFGPSLGAGASIRRTVRVAPGAAPSRAASRNPKRVRIHALLTSVPVTSAAAAATAPDKPAESVVPLAAYETLRQDLAATEDWLAEALAERED